MEYPAFVKQYKPSGTIVKKQGKTFYVYEATSVRVPGKKYPKQIIKGKVGTVDQNGFHKIKKITINIDDINVFEFGFSDYIYSYLESYKSKNMAIPRKEISKIFKSYIIYLSPNSYFSLEDFYTMQELSERFKLSTSQQLESIREILEIEKKKRIFEDQINENKMIIADYKQQIDESQVEINKFKMNMEKIQNNIVEIHQLLHIKMLEDMNAITTSKVKNVLQALLANWSLKHSVDEKVTIEKANENIKKNVENKIHDIKNDITTYNEFYQKKRIYFCR